MVVQIELDQDLSEGVIEVVEYDMEAYSERESINENAQFSNSTLTFTPTQSYYQIRYYENETLTRTSKWIPSTLTGDFDDSNTIVIFDLTDEMGNDMGSDILLGLEEEYNEQTEEYDTFPPTFSGYVKMATPLVGGPAEPESTEPQLIDPEEPLELSEPSAPWQNDGYDLSNLKIGIWYDVTYSNPVTGDPDQIINVSEDGAFSAVLTEATVTSYYAKAKIINAGAKTIEWFIQGEQGS